MEAIAQLTKEERAVYIIENHATTSVKEMAEAINFDLGKLRAEYIWLLRRNIIVKIGKPLNTNPNIVETDETDLETTLLNFSEQLRTVYKNKDKNTYANHNGLNKDIARSKWVKYIIESGLSGNLISLMNTEVSGEREILKALPNMKITGVECYKPVLNKLRQVIRKAKLPIEAKFGFVQEFMYGVDSDTYAHMILDYCGCLSTKTKELEYTINNNLVQVGGYIALTIKREIRQTNSDNAKRLLSLTNTISNVGIYNNVTDSEKLNEIYIQKLLGFNYQLVEVFNYRDTTNMTLFMIKRIK